MRLHDLNCGLKAYRAEVLSGLRLYGELHRFIPVLAHYRGFRVAEVPVNHRAREHGRSRYGLERYVRGFFDLLTVTFMGRYRYRPLHLFGGVGLALGALGMGVLVYLTALKIGGEAIGHRPLLTLGVLLVVVGIQLFSLGLVAELVTNLREEREAGQREPADAFVEDVLRLTPLRALLFGTYERSYPRNAQVVSCLRSAGVEVRERHEPVWEQRENWRAGAVTAARLIAAEARLATTRDGWADLSSSATPVIPTCPRHASSPAAGPVAFNPLVSLYDTLVERSRPVPHAAHFRHAPCGCWIAGRCARPISSSPTPTPTPPTSPSSRGSIEPAHSCFVGAEERLFGPPGAGRALHRALRRQAHPAPRAGDGPRGRATGSAPAASGCRRRPAAPPTREPKANVEHVPWVQYERCRPSSTAPVRARDLRRPARRPRA